MELKDGRWIDEREGKREIRYDAGVREREERGDGMVSWADAGLRDLVSRLLHPVSVGVIINESTCGEGLSFEIRGIYNLTHRRMKSRSNCEYSSLFNFILSSLIDKAQR